MSLIEADNDIRLESHYKWLIRADNESLLGYKIMFQWRFDMRMKLKQKYYSLEKKLKELNIN